MKPNALVVLNLNRWMPADMSNLRYRTLAYAVGAVCALAGSLPSSALATPPIQPNLAKLDIKLSPTYVPGGAADGVAVSYAYTPAPGAAAPLVLDLDTLDPSLIRKDDVVSNLKVSDDRGALQMNDSAPRKRNGSTFTEWTSARPSSGTVNVSYRMHVARPITEKRGPQFDLQAAGGGISGGYIGFLALPDTSGKSFATHVQWQLHPGDTAVSSYGEGDYTGTYTTDQLMGTLFLAGPIINYRMPGQARDGGVTVYGLGIAQEKLKATGDWTARAHAAEIKAFELTDKPYRYFIRSYAGVANPSGRASENSFLLFVPPGSDPGTLSLRDTTAHEMVHSLASTLEADQDGGDWYTEGLADYVAIVVPYAAGLYTPSEHLELVRQASAAYYTNAKRSIPNSEIATTMWSGRNAWMLPYNRGNMYLADLDAKLAAHGSKSTVLSLANEMSRRIRSGEPSTSATWLKVISVRVGTWAVSDWNDMMAGKLILPAEGAFGKCMHSRKKDVRIFDLGFSSPVRLLAGSTIGGLVQGSPAERAGLRNGDVLEVGVDINDAASSLDAPIVLHTLRDGKSQTVSVDPRNGSQPGLDWTSSCTQ